MKRLTVIISSITAIGYAVKNMGNLTWDKVILYGIVLFFSYHFIKALWNLMTEKPRKRKRSKHVLK